MATKVLINEAPKEKVFIIVVEDKTIKQQWSADEIVEEMKELVIASSGEVIECVVARLNTPTPKYLLSEPKIKELAGIIAELNVDTIVFSCDLKGSQQRNIEEVFENKTIDRTQLILDIFARHATSKEGKMQVELAQLEYLLPRLVGKGIELSRLGGGIGTLGPGETKLEVDRRLIGTRISKLKKDLDNTSKDRALKRKKRKDKGVPAISLVGYTNAGKSTLLNTLTQANQTTRDGLFTTLDSLSRQLTLSNHQKVVISDTVGFMHALPHHLIESFKATLEEVQEADLLLHVLDISNSNFRHLYESVLDVLDDLKVVDKPTIVVLNKIDKIKDDQLVDKLHSDFKESVCISAINEINISDLHDKIIEKVSDMVTEIHVDIPIDRMDLVNLAHSEGEVASIKYYNDRINIRVTIPTQFAGKFLQK